MSSPNCPVCGTCTKPWNEPASIFLSQIHDFRWPADCVAVCDNCNLGITHDGLLLRKEGSALGAATGRGGRVIYVQGGFDSEQNIALLCQLEEESARFRMLSDLSSEEARDTIWNAKHARRRFRFWYSQKREPLVIPDAHKRELIERILENMEASDKEFEEMEHNVESGVLRHRAWDYEMARTSEPILVLADFPQPLRTIFNELIDAHRWGLNRAAIALCRLMLQELVEVAVTKARLHVIPKERESRLVAELNVLHDKKFLSDEEYEAAVTIKDRGNQAVHDVTADFPAWQTIELTVELLRRMANRGFLSDRLR